MSAYVNDPRVVWAGDGEARLPDGAGFWAVCRAGGVWTVADPGGVLLTDPGDRYNKRPREFATVDEAIGAVVGVPR